MISLEADSRKNRGLYPSSCRSVCPSENMTWRAAHEEEGIHRRRTAHHGPVTWCSLASATRKSETTWHLTRNRWKDKSCASHESVNRPPSRSPSFSPPFLSPYRYTHTGLSLCRYRNVRRKNQQKLSRRYLLSLVLQECKMIRLRIQREISHLPLMMELIRARYPAILIPSNI